MTVAGGYHEITRKCVPYYEAFYGTVLDFIQKGDKKILEPACCTGMLTEMIVAKCPGAQVTCEDSDAWMIKKAFAKPAISGVKFIEWDMKDAPAADLMRL